MYLDVLYLIYNNVLGLPGGWPGIFNMLFETPTFC